MAHSLQDISMSGGRERDDAADGKLRSHAVGVFMGTGLTLGRILSAGQPTNRAAVVPEAATAGN